MTVHSLDAVRKSPFYKAEHEAFRESLRRFVAARDRALRQPMGRGRRVPARALQEGRRRRLHGPRLSRSLWRDRGRPLHAHHRHAGDRARRLRRRRRRALFSHTIGAPPILHRGSEAMKARVLPQILSGEKISALAITEPRGGSDVANLRTTARREGEHYRRQRLQDLHHLGHARRFHHARRAHRRPRRERRQPHADRGRARGPATHAAEENGLVVLGHRDALFRERARARREPHRPARARASARSC